MAQGGSEAEGAEVVRLRKEVLGWSLIFAAMCNVVFLVVSLGRGREVFALVYGVLAVALYIVGALLIDEGMES